MKQLEFEDGLTKIIPLEEDFIYVPSRNIYVSREKTFGYYSWEEAHRLLALKNRRMITAPEFLDFLGEAKENYPEFYNNLIKRKEGNSEYDYDIDNQQLRTDKSCRLSDLFPRFEAEWLDTKVYLKNNEDFWIDSNHEVIDGKIIAKKSAPLEESTINFNLVPGISIDSWIKTANSQGFPTEKAELGQFHYSCPKLYSDRFFSVGYFVNETSDISFPPNRIAISFGGHPLGCKWPIGFRSVLKETLL